MKRTIAIILVVILSNVLIYWITSSEKPEPEPKEEAAEATKPLDPVEEKPVEAPRSLLLPAEAVEALKKPREVDPRKIFTDMAGHWKNAARQSLPYLVVVETHRETSGGETALPAKGEAAPNWHARKEASRSAGIVLDDGISILTTYDLISGASQIKIHTLSGQVLQARPVAADLVTRLAVVQVAKKLPSDIRWGLAVEVGLADSVMTLYMDHEGEPRCVLASVTGLGYTSNPVFSGTVKSYLSLDLDDTQMMPGGLVVNAEGQAIGMINSMGQAIMTEQVVFVADSLIRLGEVRRAWLGVQVQPLTTKLAPHFGHKGGDGFLITSVAPDSPASRAGLVPGDVITRIQGQVIRKLGLFRAAVSETAPGSAMSLTFLRDGEPMEINIQLGLLAQEPPSTVRWDNEENGGSEENKESKENGESNGNALATVEDEAVELPGGWALPDALRVRDEENENPELILEGIDLERAVLSEDLEHEVILLSINRQPVRTLADFSALKETLAAEASLLLEIKNGTEIRYLILEKIPD